jgi:hypothetical protein
MGAGETLTRPGPHDPRVTFSPEKMATESDISPPRGNPFPIVGIGASAGNLEAFGQLLDAADLIQRQCGAAIIFVTAFEAVFLRHPGKMLTPGICLSKPFSTVQLKSALDSVTTG